MKKYINIHMLNSGVFIVLVAGITTLLLSKIPLFEPLNDSVTEWDFTDLFYRNNSKLASSPIDTNVVIVNIGRLSRQGIGKLLNQVNQYRPKVVGIDVRFSTEKDPVNDSALSAALNNTKNLVMVGSLQKVPFNQERDGIAVRPSLDKFTKNAVIGMSSLIPGKKDVIRSYFLYEDDQTGRIYSFSTEIVRLFQSESHRNYSPDNQLEKFIKYQNTMDKYYYLDYDAAGSLKFFYLQKSGYGWEWIAAKKDLSFLRNKIVLFGYVGQPNNTFQDYFEDAYYSPFRSEILHFNFPDMYGVVIHANIISMILNNDEVRSFNSWNKFYNLIILYLFLILINIVELKKQLNKSLTERIIALAIIFVLIFMSVRLFSMGIYVNLTFAVFWLLFAPDVNEFYQSSFQQIYDKLNLDFKKIFLWFPIGWIIITFTLSTLAQFATVTDLSLFQSIIDALMLCYFLGLWGYGFYLKRVVERNS